MEVACIQGVHLVAGESIAHHQFMGTNGVAFTANLPEGTYRVYAKNGEFLALSHMVDGKLTTIKSFWSV